MCPPCNSSSMCGGNSCCAAKKLNQEPEAQHNDSRQLNDFPDDKKGKDDEYPRPREGNHISAQHACNCPACPYTGNPGLPIQTDMYNGRPNPADEIE